MFQKIYLEISNICNLQCTFCPAVERDKAIMSEGSLRDYLTEIKTYAERVCFHVMGEPLGHKEFPRFVTIAQEMGVPLEITTNGTLLSHDTQNALLNPAVVQVNFSVQSFFDNFPKSDPQTYIHKIIQFALKAELERPDLYVNFRLWNLDSSILNDERNEQFLQVLEKTFGTSINRTVDPGFKKSKKLKSRIYVHFDSRFEWP
ncbi:MAG: radical SAM protein, partial [Bdellovibrionaceae bacterium]|nr:radical SAM protein [Pseudobdellovibrionaceae bacterium]